MRTEKGEVKVSGEGALTVSPDAKQFTDAEATCNTVEMDCCLRSDSCFQWGTKKFIGSELWLRSMGCLNKTLGLDYRCQHIKSQDFPAVPLWKVSTPVQCQECYHFFSGTEEARVKEMSGADARETTRIPGVEILVLWFCMLASASLIQPLSMAKIWWPIPWKRDKSQLELWRKGCKGVINTAKAYSQLRGPTLHTEACNANEMHILGWLLVALVKWNRIEKHLVTLKCQGLSPHSKERRLHMVPQRVGVFIESLVFLWLLWFKCYKF